MVMAKLVDKQRSAMDIVKAANQQKILLDIPPLLLRASREFQDTYINKERAEPRLEYISDFDLSLVHNRTGKQSLPPKAGMF